MLSATDPVAVVALLKEVGASKRLGTVIEGESLFNDGSAFVLFLMFLVSRHWTGGWEWPSFRVLELLSQNISGRESVRRLHALHMPHQWGAVGFTVCLLA